MRRAMTRTIQAELIAAIEYLELSDVNSGSGIFEKT